MNSLSLHVLSRTFVLFTAVEARLKMYSCIYLYHDIGGSDVPSSADVLLIPCLILIAEYQKHEQIISVY